MRRMLGLALFSMLFSATLVAAQESQTFYLAKPARAGNIELPRGICEVSWNAASRSRAQLSIKTEDEKTVTVPVRMVEGKQDRTGVVTSVVNGVTYLREFDTKNARFIIQNGADGSK